MPIEAVRRTKRIGGRALPPKSAPECWQHPNDYGKSFRCKMNMMGLVVEVPSKTRAVASAVVGLFLVMMSLALYGLGVSATLAMQFGSVGLLCSLITMVEQRPMRGTLICIVAGAVLWSAMQLVMGE